MKKSRFPESQVQVTLTEGRFGMPVTEACSEYGMNNAIYGQWKGKNAGARLPELKRVKEREAEKVGLTLMYAQLGLKSMEIKYALFRML